MKRDSKQFKSPRARHGYVYLEWAKSEEKTYAKKSRGVAPEYNFKAQLKLACSRFRDSRIGWIEKARTWKKKRPANFSRAFYFRVFPTIWEPRTKNESIQLIYISVTL